LVAPQANPPVAKIINYGKFKYEQEKAEQKAKKGSKAQELKEIRFSPKIGAHDLEIKAKHVRNFLEEGHRVKITMVFRGREMMFKRDGEQKLREIARSFAEIAKVEIASGFIRKQFSLVLVPSKK